MPKQVRPPKDSLLLEQVHELRRCSTDAERELWFHLRGRRMEGWKFRRQHPVPPYIVDFFCEAALLVVELDGSQHGEEVDQVRTRFLESRGLKVLRFWNNDVLKETDAVLEAILEAVWLRPLTPAPLPVGEGLPTCDPETESER